MEISTAARRLAALGHKTRLSIFRLLAEGGLAGVSAGILGDRLGLVPATLSFHLAQLSGAGLIKGTPESRFIYYAADYAAMDALLAFIVQDCCRGAYCLPKTSAMAAQANPKGGAKKKRSKRKAKK